MTRPSSKKPNLRCEEEFEAEGREVSDLVQEILPCGYVCGDQTVNMERLWMLQHEPGNPCFIKVQLLEDKLAKVVTRIWRYPSLVQLLLSLQEVPSIRKQESLIGRNDRAPCKT